MSIYIEKKDMKIEKQNIIESNYARNVIGSLSWLRIVKNMICPLPNIEGFGGIPGTEAYQMKNEYIQRRRLRRINSPPKVKFSRL